MFMGEKDSHTAPEGGERPQPASIASQIRAKNPVLFGKYELLSRLRVGGMAELFRARELARPDRIVAVKRILPSFTDEADYVAMFIDEARLGMRLKHPGIVEALELGQVDDELYIALELVQGQDLGALLKVARERKEPVPASIVCRIALDVCAALQYAHELCDEQGSWLRVVHRDVSPQNVLVSYDGAVKLIDFGIAKSAEQVMRTQAGLLKGKHGYLSPEQARGESVDRRSDLFSLGICLYEMLSADRLFLGKSDFSTIVKVRNAEVPDLRLRNPDVPEGLAAIVARSLARRPADRFATAEEMGEEIQAFVQSAGLRCDRAELASYLQERFAKTVSGEAEDADAPREAGTGLLDAFDDVQPPSAVSALAELEEQPALDQAAETRVAEPPEELLEEVEPEEEHEDYEEVADVASTDDDAEPITASPPASDALDSRSTIDLDSPSLDSHSTQDLTDEIPDEPTRLVAYQSTTSGELAQRGADLTTRMAPATEAESAPLPRVGTGPHQPIAPEPSPAPPQSPAPAAYGSTLPGLGMDWDDEELSTHVYDSPEAAAQLRGLPPIGGLALPGTPLSAPSFVPGTQQPFASVPPPAPSLRPIAGPSLPPAGAPSPFGQAQPAAAAPAPAPAPAAVRSIATVAPGRVSVPIPVLAGALSALVALAGLAALWMTRTPARASLHLTAEPADAVLLVDGVIAGGSGSPYVVSDVKPDVPHELEVQKPGYKSWRNSVTLQPGEVMELPHVQLMQEPAFAVVKQPVQVIAPKVAAPPDTVEAPTQVTPPPRFKTVSAIPTVHMGGSSSARSGGSSGASRGSSSRGSSAASGGGGTGTLRINSRPWSRVLVDGRMIGNTPLMDVMLSSGRHTVTLMNPDFGMKKTITVQIKTGERVTQIVELAK
ncbi:MAG: protein kinase [Polyangiales bacterium]